jgi:hypothetical protein
MSRFRVGHGHNVRKKSVLHLILGGAAVHRCDNWLVFKSALAAEVRPSGLQGIDETSSRVCHG